MKLLGSQIDNLTKEEAVAKIMTLFQGRAVRTVFFVNAEGIVRSDLEQGDLCLPDGVGLIWAANFLGTPLKDNVNGTDLFPLLAGSLASRQTRVYLFGGQEEVVGRVAEKLSLDYPGIKVVGYRHGYGYDDREVIKDIVRNKTEVVLVALGTPQQEKWINTYKNDTKAKVLIGVGGLFDFYSGKVPRAPHSWRLLGLEWLWRLIIQPWRLRRQLALFKFIFLVLKAKML